ncbi:MAG: Ppx/GppA phosphatase family protein [Bacteroidota bacterium]|nr:Ppx/GppA phosphatase family protein [Bacteroidota bacterium]
MIRAAALDIGTNTLLMTIAEFREQSYCILADEHRIARLGEKLDQTGFIIPEAAQRAIEIVRHYRTIADSLGVQHRLAVGTSAFRRAANAEEIAADIAEVWGGPVKVITGAEEAHLTYLGTVDSAGYSAVLDIGGGSTELIAGNSAKIDFQWSLEIGAVRLAERYWTVFPAPLSSIEYARAQIEQVLKSLHKPPPLERMYGVAGTPTTLALIAQGIRTFHWDLVDGYYLTREIIESIWKQIAHATLSELCTIPGVHPQRADILPAGTLILRTVMDFLEVPGIVVSARGLRHGVLRQFFNEQTKASLQKNSTWE